PFVPGHEVVGEITAVADRVVNLKVGQKVGLGWHAGYCNHCHSCESGDHNLCATTQPTIGGLHGGFADKVRAQETAVIVIPEGIDLHSAGPLFCAGITVFNPLVQFAIPSTAKVTVIGIGGLGHIAVKFLRAWGCEVSAFTSSEAKKQQAMAALGVHHAIDATSTAALDAAAGPFDLIMSTVNMTLDWNRYVTTLVSKARLHFVGATLAPLDISVFPLLIRLLSISGSPVGSPSVMRTMLAFAARHKIAPTVEYFCFEPVNEAFERLRSDQAHYRVVLTK
ncbi:MAG: NAD(P)-dependent alcohol dehydrogenase, partial [Shewanella sp.]